MQTHPQRMYTRDSSILAHTSLARDTQCATSAARHAIFFAAKSCSILVYKTLTRSLHIPPAISFSDCRGLLRHADGFVPQQQPIFSPGTCSSPLGSNLHGHHSTLAAPILASQIEPHREYFLSGKLPGSSGLILKKSARTIAVPSILRL